MHEISVASNILDTVETAIGPGKAILSVSLALGPFAGIAADSLQFCFAELAQMRGLGTPGLKINHLPVQAVCTDCGTAYVPPRLEAGCPQCGAFTRRFDQGFECQIESVTFEERNSHELEAQ